MSEQDESTTEDAQEATEERQDQQADAQEADAGKELEETDTEDAWDAKRAKEKIRKLNQEIRSTKDRLSKAPKAEDVQAKDQRISELEAANLRYDVGYELGLPREIAQRLQGATREEMLADAEKLVELIAPTKAPSTRRPAEALRGGTQPEQEPEETDVRKIGERMFAR